MSGVRSTPARRPLTEPELPSSGRGYEHVCPVCAQQLDLYDTRDGDQAYWCARCGRGHRAGSPPLAALRPLAGGVKEAS
jgi:hypothetical protein